MIPLQLTIEGIYSFKERQIIDFEKLTNSGLFGIFGEVGSGKSSILEAITFALFGETDRMNNKERRNYNMMNLKSNRLFIEFDFMNFEKKVFRIQREFKRNSKNFKDVKSNKTTFYEKINNEWRSLKHTKSEKIIGISYDYFKKTIIIPQGKFREFIDLGGAERAKMMKEIFYLEQYDLSDKIKILGDENTRKIEHISGQISGIEEATEEKIAELEILSQSQKEEVKKISNNYNILNERFQLLKNLKKDFEDLNRKNIEFGGLLPNKVSFEKQEEQVNLYEKIYGKFHYNLQEKQRVERELLDKKTFLGIIEKRFLSIENQKNSLEKEIVNLKFDFENLPQKRKEESDLELIAGICKLREENEIYKNRNEKGESLLKEIENKRFTIENSIKELEDEIQNLNAKKINSQLLLEVANWYSNDENLKEKFKNQSDKIKSIEKEIEGFSLKIKGNLLNFSEIESEFDNEKRKYEKQRIELNLKKNHLEVQQKLSQYTDNLKDGEACPLCGSLEHPNISENEDVSALILEVEKEIQVIDNQWKIVQENYNNDKLHLKMKQEKEKDIEKEKQIFETIGNELLNHSKSFIWKEFNQENRADFELKKKKSLEVEEKIVEKNNFLDNFRKELNEINKNIEKYKEELSKIRNKEIEVKSKIEQNIANLKVLNFKDFETQYTENVIEMFQKLKNENDELEKKFKHFETELNTKIIPQFSEEKAKKEQIGKDIEKLNYDFDIVIQNIDKELVSENITLAEVENILNLKLDVLGIREEINRFKIEFETLKKSIDELKSKLEGLSFNEKEYSEKETQLIDLQKELKIKEEQSIRTNGEIDRLKLSFEKKKNLMKDFAHLEERKKNLEVMKRLFMASGFVEYVANVHLVQLCEKANLRFQKMTKNQLSLRYNAENKEFEVVDYLNEGYVRSVKTLSGGQSFQVSLSLALALAESVQTDSKAEKNFFFIDEGFGTLDTDSVDIVFETLNQLNKENRIVGIISHVEELKERIPTTIRVVKDEKRGSYIS